METRSKLWQQLVVYNCAKLRMGAVFGGGTTFGPKGAEAMANMLGEMAIHLDTAIDMMEDKDDAFAKLKDEYNKVTSEGNDV